jgi:hypothetical protein
MAAMLATHGVTRKKIVPLREVRIARREIYPQCAGMKQIREYEAGRKQDEFER